jgi:hypothetical protein
MASICVLVSLGSSKTLLVDDKSNNAFELGVLVPSPIFWPNEHTHVTSPHTSNSFLMGILILVIVIKLDFIYKKWQKPWYLSEKLRLIS